MHRLPQIPTATAMKTSKDLQKPLIPVETGTVMTGVTEEDVAADDRKTLIISLCTVALSVPALIGA